MFFLCLDLFHGYTTNNFERYTKELAKQWGKSNGVSLLELDALETLFKLNVDVFKFDLTRSPPCLEPVRRSRGQHPSTMNVLLYKRHFCYIQNIDQLGHAFTCSKCRKCFRENHRLTRHEKTCNGGITKVVFPGGVYHPTDHPLVRLQAEGVPIPTEFTHYPGGVWF